ncbi:hypothetical protein G7Z17_g3963 [Cylindrodendrum hubeiense]|uniref:Rhodopsin domain-containing protein n=1 Tax=Cylindrodendrum hubeiense TaxID=595255 RepID=A0A9P5HBK1_9HYPO|nr:hypothetical protein G7Z17_g3963 [Cylindrodendrum hubeiense]
MTITVDPVILAAFGPPPDGLDIEEQLVVKHNVAVSVSFGLAVVSVALRLYMRRLKGAHLWFDDYAIIFSTFCCGATVAITVLAGKYGAGEHIWVSNIPRIMNLSKVIYAEGYIYGLSVTTTKISILLLYRRLLSSASSLKSLFFILYWLALFLAIAYPIVLWVTLSTACTPISYYWNQYIGAEGHCINIKLFFLALGIINMLNDVMILIVPIPRILELQLSKRLKISTICIMLLGGFIEPSVAIISACLPTFAPLFRFKNSHRSGSNPYYISDKTDASRKGTQVPNNMRNPGRFGMSSPGIRNNTTRYIIEEDEVELTCKVAGGDAVSSHEGESKRNSREDRGIVEHCDSGKIVDVNSGCDNRDFESSA